MLCGGYAKAFFKFVLQESSLLGTCPGYGLQAKK